jgi:putative flippase GtrA
MFSYVYKFFFVGVGSVVINLTAMLLLSKLNAAHVYVNVAVSFFCGVVFSYIANCKYTFRSISNWPRVLGYIALVALNLAVTFVMVFSFWNIFFLESFYGVLFSCIILPPLNFMFTRYLFAKDQDEEIQAIRATRHVGAGDPQLEELVRVPPQL